MNVVDAARKLQLALRRLEEPQGTVARRNARSAVASALRAIRGAVDTEYPSLTIRKTRPVAADPVRREQVVQARLRRRGYIPVGEVQHLPASTLVPMLAGAGVKVIVRKRRSSGSVVTWVPAWATAFYTMADFRRARTDVRWREARLAVRDAQQVDARLRGAQP